MPVRRGRRLRARPAHAWAGRFRADGERISRRSRPASTGGRHRQGTQAGGTACRCQLASAPARGNDDPGRATGAKERVENVAGANHCVDRSRRPHICRTGRVAAAAAVVAMVQSGAGAARRSQAVGAGSRACWAHFPLRAHLHRVGDRLDGRNNIPGPHDQGRVRDRRAANRHDGRSLGAPVDRGIPYGSRLPACRSRACSRRRSAASPYAQTQRRSAADDLGARAPVEVRFASMHTDAESAL